MSIYVKNTDNSVRLEEHGVRKRKSLSICVKNTDDSVRLEALIIPSHTQLLRLLYIHTGGIARSRLPLNHYFEDGHCTLYTALW